MVVVLQDFLISLKMLAVKRAETAGRPHLADAFDLRTLRALGTAFNCRHCSTAPLLFFRRSTLGSLLHPDLCNICSIHCTALLLAAATKEKFVLKISYFPTVMNSGSVLNADLCLLVVKLQSLILFACSNAMP
jgi:hypothetical protein